MIYDTFTIYTNKDTLELILVSSSNVLTHNNFNISKMLNSQDNKDRKETKFHRSTSFNQMMYFGIIFVFNLG